MDIFVYDLQKIKEAMEYSGLSVLETINLIKTSKPQKSCWTCQWRSLPSNVECKDCGEGLTKYLER